jgi:hypothetical protein
MPQKLLKRIPKTTDMTKQQKVLKSWSATIVESHSPVVTIPICSAKKAPSKGRQPTTRKVHFVKDK